MHHFWCSGCVPEVAGVQTVPGTEKGPIWSEHLPPNGSLWRSLGLLWGPWGLLWGPLGLLWGPLGRHVAPIGGPRAGKGRPRRSQEAILVPSKNINIHCVFVVFSSLGAPGGDQRETWVDLGGSRWGRKGDLGTLGGPLWSALEAFGPPVQVGQVDLSKRRLQISGTQANLK